MNYKKIFSTYIHKIEKKKEKKNPTKSSAQKRMAGHNKAIDNSTDGGQSLSSVMKSGLTDP